VKLAELLEARKKSEPSWADDYASGYEGLRGMQQHLGKHEPKLQLFVPKNRDPKLERELDTRLRLQQVRREIQESATTPVLTAFRESPVNGTNKPSGAFWTSTAIRRKDGYTSDWYQYVLQNHRTWQTDYGFLFEVKPDTLVLPTLYLEQFYEWAERVGRTEEKEWMSSSYGRDKMRLNYPWKELAKAFDGVHHGGHAYDDFTYGWDVESTAWFNTSRLKFKGAVKLVKYHEDEDEE